MTDRTEREQAWRHPWLRIQLLIRAVLCMRWDAATWPMGQGGAASGARGTQAHPESRWFS
jgi:hypothetical protein